MIASGSEPRIRHGKKNKNHRETKGRNGEIFSQESKGILREDISLGEGKGKKKKNIAKE